MPLFRSQYVGQVEVLEDDVPVPDMTASASPAKQKNAARSLLLHEANTGLQDTKAILRTTVQSHEVAVATASSLSAQTKQLEGITEDLQLIEGTVERAGNTVHQLTRNPLCALVEKPLTRRKRKSRHRRLNSTPDSSSGQPHESPSNSGESTDELRSSWLARRKEELIPSRAMKDKRGGTPKVDVLEDDYSEFDDEVKHILRKQDDYLDQTSTQLAELRKLALGMNAELDQQAEIVESIDAPKITGKLRYNNAKLRRKFKL